MIIIRITIRIRMMIRIRIIIIRIIRRPSGEEGASAFRACLIMYKDIKKRERERVRGPGRVRANPGPRDSLTGLSLFWRL